MGQRKKKKKPVELHAWADIDTTEQLFKQAIALILYQVQQEIVDMWVGAGGVCGVLDGSGVRSWDPFRKTASALPLPSTV